MVLELTDRQKIGHLLRRFGFGAGIPDLEKYANLSVEAAVDKLLDFSGEDDLGDPIRFAFKKDEDAEPGGYRFRMHWILQMITTENPLREKLALFWHDHFACNDENVSQGLSMLDYMQKLRTDPHGKFSDILKRMVTSTAVMRELNVEMISKAQPNENFARELLELYTLGIGHYSEEDIKEVSRAVTGWAYMDVFWRLGKTNSERLTMMSKFDTPALFYFYAPEAHIGGEKSVLNTKVDGLDDVIKLLVKHPQTAKNICTKLWEWFVYPHPENAIVERLSAVYQKSDGSIKAILREMTRMDEFWSPQCYRNLVKNPVDYVISIIRAQNGSARVRKEFTEGSFDQPMNQSLVDNLGAVLYRMDVCGMNIFYPPSVAGWDWDKSWISTNTVLRRREFTGIYTYYPVEKDGKTEWFPDETTMYVVNQLKSRKITNVDELTSAFLTIYDCPISPSQYEVMKSHFTRAGGVAALENERHIAWQCTLALQLLGSSPDFQLC